jgi:hypothetical protein
MVQWPIEVYILTVGTCFEIPPFTQRWQDRLQARYRHWLGGFRRKEI